MIISMYKTTQLFFYSKTQCVRLKVANKSAIIDQNNKQYQSKEIRQSPCLKAGKLNSWKNNYLIVMCQVTFRINKLIIKSPNHLN